MADFSGSAYIIQVNVFGFLRRLNKFIHSETQFEHCKIAIVSTITIF
jgi:hypothetical protein